MYESAAQRIIEDYFNIENERLFILTDSIKDFSGKLAKSVNNFAKSKGIKAFLIKQPEISYGLANNKTLHIFKMLRKNDCLFICLNGNIGASFFDLKKGFRAYVRSKGTRFSTMVGLRNLKNEEALLKAINSDMKILREKGKKLKEKLDNGSEITILGKGTKLKANIEHRKAWFNSGEFFNPGTGGNIPAGNVNIFPDYHTVNGEVLIDVNVKVGADTIHVKNPVKFIIQDGEIIDIEGAEETVNMIYNDLNNFSFINAKSGFDPRAIFRVGEIGFGLLPGKPIGLNLLDEKLENICHISNGNTFGKGGRIKCRGQRDHLFWLDRIRIH